MTTPDHPANVVPSPIAITAATTADGRHLHTRFYADRPWPRFDRAFRRRLRQGRAGRGAWLVARAGKTAVGSGQLVPWPGRGEIADLFVDPAWRGRGVGRALVAALAAAAGRQGVARLEIAVSRDNERALALYLRLGFTPVRELPGAAPALLLSRPLADTP